MSTTTLHLTSLKSICSEQGTPYHEVSYDDSYGHVIQRSLSDVDVVQIPTPYVYCGLVRDANVFANTFIHARNNACVFQGQSLDTVPELGHFKTFAEAFIGARQNTLFQDFIEEECVFLGGMAINPHADGSGFHLVGSFERFVSEFLVRMAIFDLYGLTKRLPVVVYEEVPKAWVDFICMAGGVRDRLIRVPAGRVQAYRGVWVASSPRYYDRRGADRLWDAGIHWLRYKLLQFIGGPRLSPRRRLYLRSGGGATRRILNEEQIIAALARYGVERVDLDDLSAHEQVEIVSGAEMIIATADAGAAMSWLAPEHCAHIILTPQGSKTGLWGGVGPATFLRQPYVQLGCVGVEPSIANKLADLSADVDALCSLVQTALGVIDCSHVGDATRI